jgi:2-isopropylmalate synthase
VRFARKHCPDVEFSPEDGSRSDLDFLCRVLEAVIKEGAPPSTARHGGLRVPQQFGRADQEIREKVPNSDKAVWCVHCHNDLGMAWPTRSPRCRSAARARSSAPSTASASAPGNTSLEEVVMAVRTRKDFFNLNTEAWDRYHHIVPDLAAGVADHRFVVQPNKAVVGANAFAHASGIHQDGVLKARNTYEIMRAEDVGWSTNKIVLGKLSAATPSSSA